MAKKKNNTTVVNNIDSVNVEIDYDKLAEAIVKAQQKAEVETIKETRKTSKFRTLAMSFFNGSIYSVIYVLSIYFVYIIWTESYGKPGITLISCIIFTALFAFVAIYAFLCQQETYNDKATDVHQHFNTNVSLVALIVALIALVKEVG